MAENQGSENVTGKGKTLDEGSNQGQKDSNQGQEEKTVFTKSEVDELLQKEADRRVTMARRKMEEEFDKRIQDALEKERERIEKEKLEAQGKWQDLAEKTQAELDALKSKQAALEFKEKAVQALKEVDLTEFADVLLSPRETVDRVREIGLQLRELVDKKVEQEVRERLDTGKRPQGQAGDIPLKVSEMNEEQKMAYIEKHGINKWIEKINQELINK